MGASAGRTVIVLGGGVGGVATAVRLRRRLSREHRVVLVNRDADFSFASSYLWVMSGDRRPDQVTRPLQKLTRRGIEVVIGEVDHINPAERAVTVNGRVLAGDHLVVTLGADWVTDRIPGLAENGHTFATLPGAQELGAALKRIDTGRIVVATAAPLYKCPASPYEAAFLIDARLRERGIRNRVELVVHSAEPAPMPVAGKDAGDALRQLMASRNIDYHPSSQITSAEPGKASFAGTSEAADLLVYMPPITAPAVVADSELAAGDGWIHPDPTTLATGHPSVWAIGDNTQIMLALGKPLPRAGVFAHRQAHVVADEIVAAISGRPTPGLFNGHGGCFIETGAGHAAYGAGDFYAEPTPTVTLHPPARQWHLGKALFELNVMRRWL